MKANRWWLVLLCGAALVVPAPARAQDEEELKPQTPTEEAPKSDQAPKEAKKAKPYQEPALHRWGGMELVAGAWNADLAGANYDVASVYQSGRQGIVSQVLELPASPVVRATAAVRWLLPHDYGTVEFAWDSIRHSSYQQRLTPGVFQYGELAVLPDFAGVADDGLADGYRGQSLTKSRRFRLEYAATAFQSGRVKGTWHAGYHTVDHSRHMEARYFALAPNLPPSIPPIFQGGSGGSNVIPRADSAIVDSTFSGEGPAAGLDIDFAVHPRVSVVGGLAIGILDGKLSTKYASITHTYSLLPGQGNPGGFLTYDELLVALDDPVLATLVNQLDTPANLSNLDSGHVAEDIEAYIGVQGRIWRSLRAYLRFRAMELVDVGADARPTSVKYFGNLISMSTTVTSFSQESRSVGYVGFELGFSYRF